MCFKKKITCSRCKGELAPGMADFSSDSCKKCIGAVVNDGMKLKWALRKFGVQIKARTPEYQRLYRHINKLKAKKKLQTSVCGIVFCLLRAVC